MSVDLLERYVGFACAATFFAWGAGDGNRTRTVSLGIRHGPAIHAPWPDLTWSCVICLDPGLLHADCTSAANARSGNLMLSYRVHCPCLANPRLSRRLPSRKPCAAQLLVGARVRLALRLVAVLFWSAGPLHPELRATATMLVLEHARTVPNPAG